MGKEENKIEKYLMKQSKLHGYLCFKTVVQSNTGFPDRILIGHNKCIFVEVKTPTGILSDMQNYTIKLLQKYGASVYVVYDKTQVDELFDLIKDI